MNRLIRYFASWIGSLTAEVKTQVKDVSKEGTANGRKVMGLRFFRFFPAKKK